MSVFGHSAPQNLGAEPVGGQARLDVKADDVAVGPYEMTQFGIDDVHATTSELVDVSKHHVAIGPIAGDVGERWEPFADNFRARRRPSRERG